MQFISRAPGDSVERPNAQQPLGVKFPGYTFNEDGLSNWVGHLISKHCPEPRFDPNGVQEEAWIKSPLLVHDYAKGGDIVQGIQRQVERLFLLDLGKRPEWASWTECETLFSECKILNQAGSTLHMIYFSNMGWDQRLRVCFVKLCLNLFYLTNDRLPGLDATNTIKHLFSIQKKLYETGARNFLFIDVPPVHRSPAGKYS